MNDDKNTTNTAIAEEDAAARPPKHTTLLLKSQPIMIVFSVALALLSIYVFRGTIMTAFQTGNLHITICNFLLNYLLFLGLYGAEYFYASKKSRNFSTYIMSSLGVFITCVLCILSARYLNIYAMPVNLVAILIGMLAGKRIASGSFTITVCLMVANLVFCGAVPDRFSVSALTLELVGSALVGTALIVLSTRHLTRFRFLVCGVLCGLLFVPFAVIGSAVDTTDVYVILWSVLWAFVSDLLSIVLFLPFLAVFESVFRVADDFKLEELCSFNQPLMKRLATEAPGTYNHSLVVGILAESCAIAIGENPLMARACAYYHDVGKLKAPIYFVENQSDYNPHDELIPEVSVSMITSHTMFGEILNKQYHLPDPIVRVSKEHHGTAPVGYFYQKASDLTEDGLPIDKYVYPGPKPTTKISAIVMIADTVEAAARANMPDTKEKLVAKIDELVDQKMRLGQFDDCPLTLHDISLIKEKILNVLPSVHHARISYSQEKKTLPSIDPRTGLPKKVRK